MPLADPLPVASFYDLLPIEEVEFRPAWQQERSVAGSGETLYSDRAPMLWKATVTTAAMRHADAEAIMALINSRAGGLRTVLLTNPRLPYPSTDPDGSAFGTATPVLGTITDRLHVAFSGFPADYELPLGTYFSVVFDTSRRYLGQLAEARTASGAGAVTEVEITPALPASASAGGAVTVAKPAGKFRIVPNSAYVSLVRSTLSRVTFEAEQSYAQ